MQLKNYGLKLNIALKQIKRHYVKWLPIRHLCNISRTTGGIKLKLLGDTTITTSALTI